MIISKKKTFVDFCRVDFCGILNEISIDQVQYHAVITSLYGGTKNGPFATVSEKGRHSSRAYPIFKILSA